MKSKRNWLIEMKILKLKHNNRNYKILYNITDEVLIFNDENGSSIAFAKGTDQSIGVYVSDEYSKFKMWEKYPSLKGTNAYCLVKEQIKILLKWMEVDWNENKYI